MKTGYLQPLISALTGQAILADVPPLPTDVAPPGGLVLLSAGVIIGLCLLVTGIVVASFFVIRAIKRKNTPRDGA